MSTRSSRLCLTAVVAFFALFWAVAAAADALDSDGDGIRDDLDNCIDDVPNCDQIDTNSDGYGNLCDPDFNNDGLVGQPDYAILSQQWGKTRLLPEPDPDFDPDVDLNSDGVIGAPDYLILSNLWGGPPGPSGLACADGNFEPELVTCEPHARNMLIIIADDVGIDKVGAYEDPEEPWGAPETPAIDSLADQGVLFTNAWSDPMCSPTRAGALSGRYGFRTGVGGVIAPPRKAAEPGLDPSAPNIANLLRDAGYDTAAFGKWHVAPCNEIDEEGNCQLVDQQTPVFDPYHPVESGFDYFAGTMGNIRIQEWESNYCKWPKTVSERTDTGIETETTISHVYATADTADEAISHITAMREPWLAWVAFNASHQLLHWPPLKAQEQSCVISYGHEWQNVQKYAAMTERMDYHIGRLLDELGPDSECKALDRTTIIFFGDNGTYEEVITAPFDSQHDKGTAYQGGINVPFIVAGPRAEVPAGGAESNALVNTTDVFATAMDLAGVSASAEDSVSLVPYLENPAQESQREIAYAERFSPNGFGPFDFRRQAIRGEQYKLIHRVGEAPAFEFYDLHNDPFEQNDLMAEEPIPELNQLVAELASLLDNPCLSLDDGDGDCVPDDADDASDNCTLVPNGPNQGESQCDGDQDGFGNRCDGDFDNNQETNEVDRDMLIGALGASSNDPNWDEIEEMDMNCDGQIDAEDQRLFGYVEGKPPGPSGLECAGTIPCP